MDLLFKRYASPFLLLDSMIKNNEFNGFIDDFIEQVNKDKIYDIWKHKVFDKEYIDFEKECFEQMKRETINQDIDVKDILNKSLGVMDMITPQ